MIKHLLLEAGMEVNDDFKEPADHLAIYLELLSHLHFSLGESFQQRRMNKLRQKTLSSLLEWLPEFTNNCLKHDSYGFYAALSQLLLAIVRFDDGKRIYPLLRLNKPCDGHRKINLTIVGVIISIGLANCNY